MASASDIGMMLLLGEYDVARITGLSVKIVRRWRLLEQAPRYLKIGAAVRYRPEDIQASLDSRPSGGGPVHRSEEAEVAEVTA